MTSFFAEFVHTDSGFTCSDRGFRDISTAQQCSSAVSYAKSFNSKAYYADEVSVTNKPKGCYILRQYGDMYFNTDPTGERSTSISSICWKGNTEF